jgi:hypothetical protein
MMKAYDRIEWAFLHGCLQNLGFAPSWIASVMRCVTNARYAVKVNGDLTALVFPREGSARGIQLAPIYSFCAQKVYHVYC